MPLRQSAEQHLSTAPGVAIGGEGITAEDMAQLRWVKPAIVVEVAFVEWTRDGLLRHPRFIATRDDKPVRDVRREQ
jgi:ATP-dependent DNA ligase